MKISAEQQKNILENQGIVYYVVKKFNFHISEFEDMISIGTIGLIKAAINFDKSRNCRFVTFAVRCIENEILMEIRKNRKKVNVFLEDIISFDETGNELCIKDVICDEKLSGFQENLEDMQSVCNIINIIINYLSGKKRYIMLCKIASINQKIIAREVDLSQSYISRTIKSTKALLYEMLQNIKNIRENYKIDIVNGYYSLTMPINDLKKFKQIFMEFLENSNTSYIVPYNVYYTTRKVTITMIQEQKSIFFMANIIKAIDISNNMFNM